MNRPRLTVVITVFNREDFLESAIRSVLASSYQDFELLIVDDASSDDSVEIAQTWRKRDPRIRVEVNQQNLGDYGNRNRAIELVETEFLKFLDSDDLLYPHCLETMLQLLSKEPRASFGLSAGKAWPGGPCPMLLSPADCYRREFLGGGMFFCGPSSALFRTEALRKLGSFEPRGVASDYWFWLRACRTESVLLMPADLFWYRIHPGQELASAAAADQYARVQGETWIELGNSACPLDGKELELARRNYAWILARLTVRDLRAGRFRVARTRLATAGLSLGDWLRYLRRPKRGAQAGTPLTAKGDFKISAWLLEPSTSREPEDQ